MKRYEFLEHTADVAASLFGATLKELFISASACLFAVLVEKKRNKTGAVLRELEIKAGGESLEDLLKSWLDEFLYHFSTRHLVLRRIKSVTFGENSVEAKVLMEEFDAERWAVKDEVKAVTYHDLRVQRSGNRWRAHVIFDV